MASVGAASADYQKLLDASKVSNPAGALGANKAGVKAESGKELSERFLKLLVAQMSNQDPLNPLDNAQVTSQMAQINTVTGINGLNDTVNQLIGQFSRLEAITAAQLTGRTVLVEGSQLALPAQGYAVGGFSLAAPADKVTVEVRDANGVLVDEVSLGAQKDGITKFGWDGKTSAGTQAPEGMYSFKVKATANGKEVTATPMAARVVEAVMAGASGTTLVLAGGGQVAYSDVKQIL